MKTIHEPDRSLPLIEECDVIVCGGGPAGIAAAIMASRAGATTRLIEVNGCLGGVWTAGLLSWIIDSKNKPGIMQEIIARLRQRDACTIDEQKIVDFDEEPLYRGKDLERDFSYDAEQMKLILEEMVIEAGVQIRLHTRVVAAQKDQHNRASFIITESKSGREAWQARVFIDCTGDGDLAAQLGCGFDIGRDESHKTQPMTLMTLITGINANDVVDYITEWHAGLNPPKYKLFDAIKQGGVEISYSRPCLFRIRDNLFALVVNQEYGVSGINADDVTLATLNARKEVHATVNALRSLGGIWENVQIVATAEQIGIREARRIHGRTQVVVDDLISGQSHDDGVTTVTFPVDVHSTNPDVEKSYSREGVSAQPYDIPLRALIARDVEGLLMAGRCISGDFIAHSSYRVTGNAVPMGQAAGAAAALSVIENCLPHQLQWDAIQKLIESHSTVSQIKNTT